MAILVGSWCKHKDKHQYTTSQGFAECHRNKWTEAEREWRDLLREIPDNMLEKESKIRDGLVINEIVMCRSLQRKGCVPIIQALLIDMERVLLIFEYYRRVVSIFVQD